MADFIYRGLASLSFSAENELQKTGKKIALYELRKIENFAKSKIFYVFFENQDLALFYRENHSPVEKTRWSWRRNGSIEVFSYQQI